MRFLASVPCMILPCTLLVLGVPMASSPAQEKSADDLLARARKAAMAGKVEEAVDLATKAIAADAKNPAAHVLRGQLYAAQRKHEPAVADFDAAIKLAPKDANAYDLRGSEQFKLGKIKESIADFDKAIELDPKREREHWRRGISYYYAGEFEKGQKQFEAYQTFDDKDVENAVWRYLCQARRVGVEKARAEMLKIRKDPRMGMMEVYALFAGKATPEDVQKTVTSGKPKPQELAERQFYADLYIGLNYEATGDTKQAARHIQAAVKNKISHYMWDVAKVHAELLKVEKK
jgi:lipoprotein NlpI